MYLPWAREGGGESEGKEAEQEITVPCASMTAWLAALHKILFTAHTEEKLQQQFSPQAEKSADLATLERDREEGQALQLLYCSSLLTVSIYTSQIVRGGFSPPVTTGYWCMRAVKAVKQLRTWPCR